MDAFYQGKSGNYWIACDGDSVIGTIGLLNIENQPTNLRKLLVAREYRGTTYSNGVCLRRPGRSRFDKFKIQNPKTVKPQLHSTVLHKEILTPPL